jgi:cysteine synthase A
VVTVFADDNKKYLSTDLFKDEPRKKEFLSPRIKLLGFRALKRVCATCCNPEECLNEFSDIRFRMCSEVFKEQKK